MIDIIAKTLPYILELARVIELLSSFDKGGFLVHNLSTVFLLL